MQKKTLKATVLSLAMATLLLLPMTMNAQYKEHQFGLQEWGQTSLLGRQDGGNRSGGSSESYDSSFSWRQAWAMHSKNGKITIKNRNHEEN